VREQIRIAGSVMRDQRLARIQLAFFGFNMAEYATWVAILVYAYERGGASAAGAVAAIQLIPSAVVAPFGAFAGDRFPRHRVLFLSYLVQALALGMVAVALFADAAFAITLVFATVAAVTLTFTRPTQSALLPSVSGSVEQLTAANAVSTFSASAGIVIGPFVAGLLLARWGPAEVFAVFAVVALVAALLVARLVIPSEDAKLKEPMRAGEVVRESVGGFRFLVRDRRSGVLVLVLSGGIIALGALDVLFVAVAISLLGKGQSWAGFLSSAYGFGGLIGAAFAVTLVGRRRLVRPLGGGTFASGVSIAAIGAAPAVATAPLLFAAAGGGGSVSWVAGETLLQRAAPDEMLARVFGILEGLGMLALAIGSVGASALIAAFGVQSALVAIGMLAPAVMLALWVPLSAIDREAKAPDAATLAFVRRIPMFAPLPAPAIERVIAHLTRMEAPAGEVLIREGEAGDRFFMIVDGEAEVIRGGERVAELGPGEHAGEIALLRDVPRTATVTAKAAMVLLVLDREPFLEAVTGHPQSRERAEAVVTERLRGKRD
jgi:MFS family permease